MFKDKQARIDIETLFKGVASQMIKTEKLEKENSDLKDRLQKVIECLGLKEEEYHTNVIDEEKYSEDARGYMGLEYNPPMKCVIKTRFIKPKK